VPVPAHLTAHELADYARCPRAWWYERHEELAHLEPHALAVRLDARRIIVGRRADRDAEVELIERLLERHQRFAGGRAAHNADARQSVTVAGGAGCLVALVVAAALMLTVFCIVW
jgi:hypothetical protein